MEFNNAGASSEQVFQAERPDIKVFLLRKCCF